MNVLEKYKSSINLARNSTTISDEVFLKLLENCFHFLNEHTELNSLNSLYNSKADVTKEFYAALLAVTAEFARKRLSKDDITKYLQEECRLSSNRTNLFCDHFEKERNRIESSLLNIGTFLPHITDVKWKIDYIVKSSEVDSPEGPLFRICLVAEDSHLNTDEKNFKNIEFTCNSVQLLDLVFKLKDALRHCTNFTHRVF